jgi:hypothetical protein
VQVEQFYWVLLREGTIVRRSFVDFAHVGYNLTAGKMLKLIDEWNRVANREKDKGPSASMKYSLNKEGLCK